jgi:hypothetical protein
MSQNPAQQSTDDMTNLFAAQVKDLLTNFPRPMFDSAQSLLDTVSETTQMFAAAVVDFDEATAAIEGHNNLHVLNLLTSAVKITHQIALETALDLDEMLSEDGSTRLWQFMLENVGPIDHHLITPGVFGSAAALQGRIFWEAALSVNSASLAIASTLIRLSCDAIEKAVTLGELRQIEDGQQ